MYVLPADPRANCIASAIPGAHRVPVYLTEHRSSNHLGAHGPPVDRGANNGRPVAIAVHQPAHH